MKYITIDELNRTIRKNFHLIPHDVDFVIGVPRSGMLPATIISELLNCPLIDLNSFLRGSKPSGGLRLQFRKDNALQGKRKALVIDDTIFNGRSMRETKSLLGGLSKYIDFTYMVVYKEGKSSDIDIFLEDVSMEAKPIVLYEWNIFHHYDEIMGKCVYDIDGVFLPNPPDERNEDKYIEYISTAKPLFIPSNTLGAICTYRLEKNRAITENWLASQGVRYKELVMFPSDSWDGRNRSGISPEKFKANYYKSQPWAELFVESDDCQARKIAELSGKPVFCVESNKMY